MTKNMLINTENRNNIFLKIRENVFGKEDFIVFPNLKAEMARKNITVKEIAEFLGKNDSWLDNRISGKASLPLVDGVRIKNKFFPEIDIEVLFSDSAIIPSYKKAV